MFFAFDLLWLNGADLRQFPLIERKTKLRKLIERTKCSEILYAQHIEHNGKLFFEEICERNLAVGQNENSVHILNRGKLLPSGVSQRQGYCEYSGSDRNISTGSA